MTRSPALANIPAAKLADAIAASIQRRAGGRPSSVPLPATPESLAAVDTLVVRRAVGLGDVIFALSVTEALSEAAPQAHLHFVTDARFVEFASWFAFVDTVSAVGVPFPLAGTHTLDVDLGDIPVADGEDRTMVMARKVGVFVKQLVSAPRVPDAVLDRAKAVLRTAGVRRGDRLVVVAPFSSGRPPSRSMLPTEVQALLRELGRAQDGSAGPHREALTGALRTGTRKRRLLLHHERVPGLSLPEGALDLSGELTAAEAIAVVSLSDRFVGVDSGLLYAALTFRVPSVALYSHVAPLSRLTYAEGYVALRPVGRKCFPCGDFAGDAECVAYPWKHECMRLTADCGAVLTALQGLRPGTRQVRDVRTTLPQKAIVRREAKSPAARPSLLVVAPWLIAGGGERHLLLLCQGLAERADIEIAVGFPDRPAHMADQFGAWPVVELLGDRRSKARRLAQLLDKRKPDLLGFYNNPLALDALALARHQPRRVFAIIHTVFDSEMRMLNHRASGRVDAFVCVSENVRDCVAARLRRSRPLMVIRNGIRTEDFDSRGTLRAELGYGADDFVLGNIGRNAPGKNIDLAIRAVQLLPPQVKGLFIGWGEDVGKCERLVRDLGLHERVNILGPTPDVPPRFRTLDAFVLPSDVEGAVPYALMEAMAAGAAAMVTPVSDVPLLFEHGKHVLFIERSPESIAEATLRLLNSRALRKRLVENARAVVDEHLTVEAMVGRYAELLGIS